MRFPINSIISLTVMGLVVTAFAAKDDASYEIQCKLNAGKFHSEILRLRAKYTLLSNNSAELTDYKGVLIDDNDIDYILYFEGRGENKAVASDPKYKPKGEKWENHVRFYLPVTELFQKNLQDGEPELLIAREPEVQRKRFNNHVNTGTEITYTFHAGLENHANDQSGTRTELTCEAKDYEIDRK